MMDPLGQEIAFKDIKVTDGKWLDFYIEDLLRI